MITFLVAGIGFVHFWEPQNPKESSLLEEENTLSWSSSQVHELEILDYSFGFFEEKKSKSKSQYELESQGWALDSFYRIKSKIVYEKNPFSFSYEGELWQQDQKLKTVSYTWDEIHENPLFLESLLFSQSQPLCDKNWESIEGLLCLSSIPVKKSTGKKNPLPFDIRFLKKDAPQDYPRWLSEQVKLIDQWEERARFLDSNISHAFLQKLVHTKDALNTLRQNWNKKGLSDVEDKIKKWNKNFIPTSLYNMPFIFNEEIIHYFLKKSMEEINFRMNIEEQKEFVTITSQTSLYDPNSVFIVSANPSKIMTLENKNIWKCENFEKNIEEEASLLFPFLILRDLKTSRYLASNIFQKYFDKKTCFSFAAHHEINFFNTEFQSIVNEHLGYGFEIQIKNQKTYQLRLLPIDWNIKIHDSKQKIIYEGLSSVKEKQKNHISLKF